MTEGPTQQKAQEIAEASIAAMLENDEASALLGICLREVAPGRAMVDMTVRADMVNGHGILHGGFAFTLADTAFAAACNSYNRLTVAQSCDIDFTNPSHIGDVLTASCEERSKRGRSGIYDVTITNQAGVQIAFFRGRSRTLGQAIDDTVAQN